MCAEKIGLWQRRPKTVADKMQGCPDRPSALHNDRFRFGGELTDDTRHARLQDAGFLASDGRERRAEVFLVIESNRRDHANLGVADVRSVEPAAQPSLQDYHVDLPRAKFQPSRGGDELEERRR